MTKSVLSTMPRFSFQISTMTCGLMCVASAYGQAAQAQVPSGSQVPPGETVERKGPATQFSFPASQGLRAPAGSEAINFQLGNLNIEGALPDLSARTAALAPARGARISVADVYTFAAALQQAYLDAGYPLVRVLVPTQDLDPAKGDVKLLVVSGFVQSIDVTGLSPRVRERVLSILSPLKDQSPVTSVQMERQLLLAGDVAGLNLKAALAPGQQTGATRLILTGEHNLLQNAVAVDNRISEELGGEQLTASASLNSFFGLGERIVATIAFAPDKPSLGEDSLRRFGSLFMSVPVANNGLALGFEIVGTSSKPGGSSAALSLTSNFAKASLFATYPIQRRRDRSMTAKISLDSAFEEQVTGILGFPFPLFADRTRVVRAGIEGFRPLPLGINFGYDAQISMGLDALGARSKADASFLNPLSRLDADAEFQRGEATLTFQRSLSPHLSANLTLRGSTGFGDPLLRSEQTSITSVDLISGPPGGSVVGDDTLAGRLELRYAARVGSTSITPYVFIAAGAAKLQRPTALEASDTQVQGAGIGFEFLLRTQGNQRWFARIEWSNTQFDNQRPDDSRFNISLVARL